MKKQKRYKICRGLFFLVFLLAIGTRLAFWGMAAEKESAETQTGAAGAYYEEDAFYSASGNRVCREKKFL